MRVLLDEDMDIRLRHEFRGEHRVETVEFRNWKGLSNGELLEAAAAEFDVLVTMDDNLPDQQNIAAHDIAVVILRPRSKDLTHLTELVPEVERLLAILEPGEVRRVGPPA